jgi:hypothetical protein
MSANAPETHAKYVLAFESADDVLAKALDRRFRWQSPQQAPCKRSAVSVQRTRDSHRSRDCVHRTATARFVASMDGAQ